MGYFMVVRSTAGITRIEHFEREESARFWARSARNTAGTQAVDIYEAGDPLVTYQRSEAVRFA